MFAPLRRVAARWCGVLGALLSACGSVQDQPPGSDGPPADQIPFASLTQLGFGNPSPVGPDFPKSAILHFKWDIVIPMTGPTAPWELWIDDLTFY